MNKKKKTLQEKIDEFNKESELEGKIAPEPDDSIHSVNPSKNPTQK